MSMTITSPASGATVSGTIAVTGSDSGQTVTAKVGTTTVGTQSLASQNFSISVDTTTLANGTQTITVSDANGSASVSVNVQNVVVPVTKTLVLTSGTSVAMPADWNPANNKVETWGGGGGGGGSGGLGGGSGGYSSASNVNVAAGSTQPYTLGAAGVGAAYNAGATAGGSGGATFFGATAQASSLCAANGGGGGNYQTAGAGASTTGAIGAVKRAGTAGGTNANNPGGGGAGAPGPDGAGATGGTETTTVGGPGGQGDATKGGAGGAGGNGAVGAAGAANANGGGGGGGGGASSSGGNGGLPGAGGGGSGYTATSGKGGDGGAGQVRLTWTTPGGGPKVFYGINGHWDYTESAATIIAAMKYMGFTVYRMAYEGSTASMNAIVAMAQAFQADGTGLQLFVCDDISFDDTTGVLYTTASAAYNAGYAEGQLVANALAPYTANVMAIEVGNEMTRKGSMVSLSYIMGTDPSDFNNTQWYALANVCAGSTAGIRSVLPNMPVTNNALTFAEFAASDMLWNGTNPDGTTGEPAIKWDLTSLHSYASWGDPVNISMDGNGTVRFDLYAKLATNYGKPLVISEWGADATGPMTDAQQNSWNSTMLSEMYARRESLAGSVKIRSAIMYELYNTDYNWGVLVSGTSNQTTAIGANVKSFIAANPDV